MKRACLVVLAVLCAGCGGNVQPAIDQQDARLSALESRIGSVQKALDEQVKRIGVVEPNLHENFLLARRAYEQTEELAGEIQALEQRLQKSNAKIAELEFQLRRATSRLTELEKMQKGVSISVTPRETPGISDFINPPTSDDLFPIRVYDVVGRTVVTGKHLTQVYEETGRMTVDAFGNAVPERVGREKEVDEQGFQAAFSVENLTKSQREITFSAGATEARLTLGAGETRTNVTVVSAPGSDLSVAAGGHSKRFPVTY